MDGTAGATLGRRERIKSRKQVDELFAGGNSRSIAVFPLRLVYLTTTAEAPDEPAKILVSVSKRHFKRAVKRNRVKRQIREAYRQHKHLLLNALAAQPQKTVRMAFIWQADELYATADVAGCMQKLLCRLAEKL